MADVIDVYGLCEGEPCHKPERTITDENDMYVVNRRRYHKGCEPPEAANENNSSV
jgi:hypothetical protein